MKGTAMLGIPMMKSMGLIEHVNGNWRLVRRVEEQAHGQDQGQEQIEVQEEEEDTNSPWLCSWCKRRKADSSSDAEKPCVLCPKQGGALKPVFCAARNEGPADCAHLFCSQWAPGVYIEDLEKMEPIMNVEEVKGACKKLVCNICKVKWGACVRCSHGMFCCSIILCVSLLAGRPGRKLVIRFFS